MFNSVSKTTNNVIDTFKSVANNLVNKTEKLGSNVSRDINKTAQDFGDDVVKVTDNIKIPLLIGAGIFGYMLLKK